MLDAFAAVRALAPGMKLAIVGSGPCLPDLQAQARALGILSDCIFQPATPQVADWLRAIDIFVLPSHSEALSNSLMEAMASGCCVAASRVGGNPELVQHGETGMLFGPRDRAGLVLEVLRALVSDPGRRKQQLASNAAHLIQQPAFSLAASARRMGEIYSGDRSFNRKPWIGYHSARGRSPGLKFKPTEVRYSVLASSVPLAIS